VSPSSSLLGTLDSRLCTSRPFSDCVAENSGRLIASRWSFECSRSCAVDPRLGEELRVSAIDSGYGKGAGLAGELFCSVMEHQPIAIVGNCGVAEL
jgi:hypothetical protein